MQITEGGFFVKITYTFEILHSNKKNEDFYVVRLALTENGLILRKSQPILWITKEQYEKLSSE